MSIHSPENIESYLKTVNLLNNKYKGKDWSQEHSIVLTSSLFLEVVSTIVDLQNRIQELEAERD
jgi:hypothetical protein